MAESSILTAGTRNSSFGARRTEGKQMGGEEHCSDSERLGFVVRGAKCSIAPPAMEHSAACLPAGVNWCSMQSCHHGSRVTLYVRLLALSSSANRVLPPFCLCLCAQARWWWASAIRLRYACAARRGVVEGRGPAAQHGDCNEGTAHYLYCRRFLSVYFIPAVFGAINA